MDVRLIEVHHAPSQILMVRAEVRSALADDHVLEGFLLHGREKYELLPPGIGLAEGRRHKDRPLIAVPVFPGQARKGLALHHVPAEFIQVPVEGGIAVHVKDRHGNEGYAVLHGERLRFLLHVVDDEIFIVPQRRGEEHQTLGPVRFQRLPGILVLGEEIAVVAHAAHEAREAQPPGLLIAPGQRGQRIHKKTVVQFARRRGCRFHAGADAADDLAVFLAKRRI